MPLGAYIHIPFCNYKCHFCDFATSLRIEELQDQYCDVLNHEIRQRLEVLPSKPVLESIFYGGGTPGCLDISHLTQIHETLLANVNLSPDNEISFETTPETVTMQKAKEWRNLGINRLSLGVESFNDCELTSLGRGHTAAQAVAAINIAAEAGFDNISCDLMYGLPKQSLDIWQNSLAEFIKLTDKFHQIKHVSAYGLELNNSGPLAKIFPVNSGVYPTDEAFVEQLTYLINVLSESGFIQYEISNFAKPGYRSRHNLNYWQEGEYYAFGVSAHRYIKPYRSSNWRSLKRYLEDCLGNESCEFIDEQTRIKEAIMLGLRMTEGISLKQFKQTFAVDLAQKHKDLIEHLTTHNMLICDQNKLRLTTSGQPVANSVISEFF